MRAPLSACLACAAVLAGCETSTVAPPVAVGQGSPPVLDSITERSVILAGFPRVIPEFHFHDADGDVRFLAREMVETNGPYRQVGGAAVDLPPDLQKRGAVLAGGWPCGPNAYYVKMNAYLVDAAGNRSNAMTYTVHCNGG